MYDLFVIGGGINGLGVARDAAGRGLRVGLCEKDDLAAHTSSASTKLIHGGLRYLEQYDFGLVRKALIEREVLLAMAPHIIWPLRFILPLGGGGRPAWLVRLGLFIYDHLGGRRRLPGTRVVRRGGGNRLDALHNRFATGFEYSDCWVDDARLCVLNAMDARARGADILTRHECVDLVRGEAGWVITLQPKQMGAARFQIRARAVVNAAGPWVDQIAARAGVGNANAATPHGGVRLVKGSHIVLDRLYGGEHCYFFQNPDGRVIFAIPYLQGNKTLIGTTDVAFTDGHVNTVAISQDEIDYLCASVSAYFRRPVTPDQVRSSYSGVRPLYDDQANDASKVTRDYVLKLDGGGGAQSQAIGRGKGAPPAPMVSIFGGKITTYRTLAEQVLAQLTPVFPDMGAPWTRAVPLPGGAMPDADFDRFFAGLCDAYPGFDRVFLGRLARAYGTLTRDVLGEATSTDGLGRHFGQGLYEAELVYLVEREFAQTADDILFRRTKLGLDMSAADQAALGEWLAAWWSEWRADGQNAHAAGSH